MQKFKTLLTATLAILAFVVAFSETVGVIGFLSQIACFGALAGVCLYAGKVTHD